MRRSTGLVTMLLLVGLAGCGTGASVPKSTVQQATGHDLWQQQKPAAYEFTLYANAMIGAFGTRITVRDGRVVTSAPAPGMKAVPFGLTTGTIDDVFAQLDKDEVKADKVEVAYDPVWGFPVRVDVDEMTNAIDDEHRYGVRDFVAVPSS